MGAGGSTITQQLAKNLYLSPSKNPLRKVREDHRQASRSRVEEVEDSRAVSQRDRVGRRYHGADAASRTYFRTPASALGSTESALLAAAIINPRLLNPARPTTRLIRRQQLILRRMGAVVPPQESADRHTYK